MAAQMENCKLKRGTTKDAEKDSGIIGNKRGIDYHYHVAMSLCLNGYKTKQTNPGYEFTIVQEDKNAGKFDDIIYKYRENKNANWTHLLIQVKNKKVSESSIKTSNLLYDDKKNTFSLIKFIKSTGDIKDTDNNCYFIIYTNACLEIEDNGWLKGWYKKDTNEQIRLLPSKVACISVFDSGCQYKFDNEINVPIFCKHTTNIVKEDWETFLRKLVFVVGQPNLEKTKSVIENKIESILPKSTEKIRCKLLDKLDDSLYHYKEITSQEISDLIASAQEEIQLYYENKYEESEVEFKSNIPLYAFLTSENIILPITSINPEFTLHKVCKSIQKLRSEKPDVNQYTMKHVYSIQDLSNIKTTTSFNLIIICIKNNDQLQILEYILKKNGKKYIIIFSIDQRFPDMQNCHQIYEDKYNNFNLLTNASKQYILNNKCVLFNGYKSSFGEILQVTSQSLTEELEDRLNDVLTENVLKCFLDEDYKELNISFNRSGINKLDTYYIERQLRYPAVIKECQVCDFKEPYIINNLDKFKSMCKENPGSTLHYFIKYNEYLLWAQTNGDLTNLRKFINENKDAIRSEFFRDFKTIDCVILTEDQLCNLDLNTFLISSNPGMGKSLLMSNISNTLQIKYPTKIIIRLNFNDHTNSFSKNINFNNQETTVDFIKNELLTEAKPSVLSQKVFNFTMKNKNEIILLLDGFDEICPDYENVTINFINSLNKFKTFRLFVTTRPTQTSSLEERLATFALSLTHYSEEDQISYMSKVLETNNSDMKTLLKEINKESNFEDLLGTPLLLKIVIEILNNDPNNEVLNIEEILNLSQLFNKFVNKKFEIYSTEKKKQDKTNPSIKKDEEQLQKSYQEKHEILAMRLLFGEKFILEKIDDSFKDQITKIGIITQINGIRAEFIHRTFTEYFSATYIQKYFNDDRIIELLFTHVLFDWNLTILRKFVNNYEFNNEETKAKYRQFVNKNYRNMTKRNRLLSILSTAAFDNNSETVTFILDCFKENRTTLEHLLSYGYRTSVPLSVAIIKNNTQIAKQIINCCVEKIQHKQCGAYQYIFGKGDIKGNTALHDAARWGNIELVNLLSKKMTHVDRINNTGETAIHRAARYGHINTVKVLLDRVADVNRGDIDGNTPLHLAAFMDHMQVVKILLEKRADVNIANKRGNTVLHHTSREGYTHIVRMLLERGANVNTTNIYGDRPLHLAYRTGKKRLIQLFLRHDSDLRDYEDSASDSDNDSDNGLLTWLHQAVRRRDVNIVKHLLFDVNDVNAVDSYNRTPLHCAALLGDCDMLKVLLERGADVNITDINGSTALQGARRSKNDKAVEILLSWKVDSSYINDFYFNC